MENKCLITTLQGEMSGQNLSKFGDLTISAKWNADSVNLVYGPGTVEHKLDDDLIVKVLEGGTINGETLVIIPKGSTADPYNATLTITRAAGASDLVMIINNQYTMNGFGFTVSRINQIQLGQSDLEKMVNVNRFVLNNIYKTTINLTDLVEGLYANGRRKSLARIYCYVDFDYALYSSDTYVSTNGQEVYVAFNEGMTEYTFSINSNVIAKRKLVEGVWVSQPTT